RVFNHHNCSNHHVKAEVFDNAVYIAVGKALMEDLDDLVTAHRDAICSTLDTSELERMQAEVERLLRKREDARERELHAEGAGDRRYYAGQLSEFKGQIALLRRRIASFTEEADVVEVDTAAIRREIRAAWGTKVPSERRELLVGWVQVIEWIADEEVAV